MVLTAPHPPAVKPLIRCGGTSVSRWAARGRMGEEDQFPRLVQVKAFPEEQREAVRSVAAAMASSGREPNDYTAEVSLAAGGQLEVRVRHDGHPTGWSGRGDPCGRCCVARYNPKTRAVSRIIGIR